MERGGGRRPEPGRGRAGAADRAGRRDGRQPPRVRGVPADQRGAAGRDARAGAHPGPLLAGRPRRTRAPAPALPPLRPLRSPGDLARDPGGPPYAECGRGRGGPGGGGRAQRHRERAGPPAHRGLHPLRRRRPHPDPAQGQPRRTRPARRHGARRDRRRHPPPRRGPDPRPAPGRRPVRRPHRAGAAGGEEHGAPVAPASLATFGGTDATPATAWTPALSLRTGEPHRVPVPAARPFGPHNRLRTHLAATAGAGAGSSAAEAAGAALLAALAHTAVLDAVRGRAAVPLAQDAAGDAELEFLHKTAAALGLGVELLDLTGDGPAPSSSPASPAAAGPSPPTSPGARRPAPPCATCWATPSSPPRPARSPTPATPSSPTWRPPRSPSPGSRAARSTPPPPSPRSWPASGRPAGMPCTWTPPRPTSPPAGLPPPGSC